MKIYKPISFLFTFFILFAIQATNTYAQNLELHFEADSDVLAVSDRVTFTLTASNTGSTSLLDVTATVQLPEFIVAFVDDLEFNCAGNCDATEEAVWTIGTLEAGQSHTYIFRTFIQNNAPEEAISGKATVSLQGVSDIVETVNLIIDNSREMRINVAPESGPAVAGEPFTHTLTVTNIGVASVVSPVLEFAIPEGTSFVSATDGGVENAGVVSWTLGVFGAGAGRQIQVTVLPDAALSDGTLLVARASVDPNETNEIAVESVTVTPVRDNVPLRIEYGINQTASGIGDRLVYELIATNIGSTALLDVSAEVLLPEGIVMFLDDVEFDCTGNCDASEFALWTIGTLEAGQSRSVFFTTFVSNAASGGDMLKSTLLAISTGSGQVMAALDLHVDPSPNVQLSVMPGTGPAAAGEPFTYTITASNIGTASVVNPVLEFPLPEGTSFVSATDEGVEQGGVVSWSLGVLGAGGGRQLQVTVLPDVALGNGSLLLTRASLNPNETNEPIVRAMTVTPIRGNVPLHIEYGVNQTASGVSDRLVYELVATNTGTTALLDVSAEVLLPEFMLAFIENAGFDCPGNCDANELGIWTIGTLEPGQSNTIYFDTFVSNAAPDGHILSTRLLASSTGSGQVTTALDIHVDPSPGMRLHVAPDASPASAGELITYTFTLGNIDTANPDDIRLEMALPEGTSFDSASDGGVESNGVVVWNFSPLKAGEGRKVTLTVLVDASLAAGNMLVARAALNTNQINESILRSVNVTPVGEQPSVALEYIANQTSYNPGDQFLVTLNVTNTGQTDLLDLTVDMVLPQFINMFVDADDFTCPGNCDANEHATWSIGSLSPGQTRTQDVVTTVTTSSDLGELMISRLEVRPASQPQLIMFRDELVGTLANQSPSQIAITSPIDGTSVMIGGDTSANAGDPASLLNITWTEAIDPEDDPLTYTWQLSSTTNFADVLFSKTSDVATPTNLDVSHDDLASVLDGASVLVGETGDLYHRVVVSDGTNNVVSTALNIQLTRGTLVSTEVSGVPESFALHANYPNPFNPTTTISFDLPKASAIHIDIFNALGQRIKTLVDEVRPAGQYVVSVDLQDEVSGMYFYRMRADGFEAVKQMVLMK